MNRELLGEIAFKASVVAATTFIPPAALRAADLRMAQSAPVDVGRYRLEVSNRPFSPIDILDLNLPRRAARDLEHPIEAATVMGLAGLAVGLITVSRPLDKF